MNRKSLGWILGASLIFTYGFTLQPTKRDALQGTTTIDSNISKAFVMGKFMAQTHVRFATVPPMLCSKPMYLQIEVIEAFRKMRRDAMLVGIDLKIISGTRNFWEQSAIWERKWSANVSRFGTGAANAKHILLYSSMPGSSRHHWGTDIDINSLEPGYFRNGRGLTEINWLRKNAKTYGFCEVYSPRTTGRLTGYEPEAWHWSFMPLSSQYLQYYSEHITPSDFKGFSGSGLAAEVRIIEDYVKGIGCN
jgi:D-alanyl-D-alanine carboxypeptidase